MSEGLPTPYREPSTDLIYNLLFCDQPSLFAKSSAGNSAIESATDEDSSESDVRRTAEDAAVESRVRLLAFNWVRRKGLPVPARVFLGVVVEVHLEAGLDTLAAYADNRLRLIGRMANVTVVENAPEALKEPLQRLLTSAEWVMNQIGPWDKPRMAEPPAGSVRLTFLASDGIYFGQGGFDDFANDKMAGPVIDSATQLFQKLVETTTEPKR
jgi:hypothetical protein